MQDLKLEYLRNKDLTAQVGSLQLSPPSNLVPRFPSEILQHTAEYVHNTDDLMSFAMSSEQAMLAAVPWLKYPRIAGYPLLSTRPIAVEKESKSHVRLDLHIAAFGTIINGGAATIIVGAYSPFCRAGTQAG